MSRENKIMAEGVSAESEALQLAFAYLARSINAASLLSDAFSSNLITEHERAECVAETGPYQKAEKFLSHIQRKVYADKSNFHFFVQLLDRTAGCVDQASRLRDELSSATRAMQQPATATNSTEVEQITVPDELVDELATLRIKYASFLCNYQEELEKSTKAQGTFVKTLPRLLNRQLSSEFQPCFDTLVDEEVSLFNVTYLKRICDIFPEDVCAATKLLVDKYEVQRQKFLNGTRVKQFKKLFPASAVSSKLLSEKISITLKLENYWGDNTLDDLTKLVGLFGVTGKQLHLAKAGVGSIVVLWLCSTTNVDALKRAINKAADDLQPMGVLQVLIREEAFLDFDQKLDAHEPRTFEFVSEPEGDYFCPVCRDLLTDPIQPDCGHHLCRKCCDRLLSSKKVECPTCRESNALSDARVDRYFLRRVNSVAVRCKYHNEGCEWVGEVRYLQDHLDHCAISCPYDCGIYSSRIKMKEHKAFHCPNRPVKCEYCDYYNTFAIVTEKHNPICPQYPVDCPNHCPVKGLRRHQVEQHFNECSHQIVDCPYRKTFIGCSVRLPRRKMKLHTKQQHDVLLEETNQMVSMTTHPSVKLSRYLCNYTPIEFVIPNFHDMKENDSVWTSVPFSSHDEGYKLCIEVYSNGYQSCLGSHVVIFAHLMKGEYDSSLVWPFEGHVVLELLNWRADRDHLLTSIPFNRFTDPDQSSASRVTNHECTQIGIGLQIISHSSLLCNSETNIEYLQDDCLRIRVVDVAVYSSPLLTKTPSWQDPHTATQSVCEFTLTEFTKRKQFDNEYYSPPFYSHPHGYKFCVHVFANGHGKGKGTHISVSIILMKGCYDNNLQWPLQCDIIIELVNWKQNNHHYLGETISYNKSLISYSNRVITGDYSTTEMGNIFFFPHSSFCNPDTNTEYLQDDCLRLRVVDVAIYSTPLLSKTPSWQDPHTATQSVCEFTLTEFTKRKQFNNAFHCPPFYSHPEGYKLCLKVYANGVGEGKDTHISIFAYLMRGDYDNYLQWPFESDIVLELLNWREDNCHYRGDTILFSRHGCRVTEREFALGAMGIQSFISHSSLYYNPQTGTEYLQDDCLRLRVVDVAVYSSPLLSKTPSWQDPHTATQSVCEFTLTGFTKRKQFHNTHYSPPFYSHPHGYKLCIIVDVYRHAEGKGTDDIFISIFAGLMRGDYDDNLQWPFEGGITVELLNWRDDSHHYRGGTIHLNRHNDPDGSITSRVTEGEYAPNGLGIFRFISYSSLIFDYDTNTEYLQDDCLRLRVVDVAVYSSPLLSKTPSWQDPHTATQSVCEFTLTEFTKRKQFKNVYFSPPFYSHPHGYKLCIRVDANEDKGTGISLFLYLMRGDYDNNLQWPFNGDIIVEILNWREDYHHYRGDTISFNGSINMAASRVTDGEYAPTCWGIDFISHASLFCNLDMNTEYLQDDCLRLRVVGVAIYSTSLLSKTPSWQDPHTATQSVCEFTLTEFTKRKQFNNVYFSPPFYSHSHGYKLCFIVDVYGIGEGKGSHLSIFICLMRGEYDNNLQWPFEGGIVVEVLNWREDSHHHRRETFDFNRYNDPDGSITSRVTDGEYAPKGYGIFSFISHSSLILDTDTNMEYLQDDCIRLRVVDVAVYSTPLLTKTPSWQDPHTATQSVCEFTLTEFTKRKQFNNEYTSPPFYSHPHGYKLCLRVDANGYSEGKGTHVSIYASLMRGDYDNDLEWPFEGDIIIEALNWKADNHHYRGDTISFNRHTDLDYRSVFTSRVTEGEYASNGWGDHLFSHSSLLYNSDTNAEYLQDDSLRFRVVDVIFYSVSLLSKTPSWLDSNATTAQSLCEFTLTNFAKRKRFNNKYYGPPFYTHFHGYRMLIAVLSNGSQNEIVIRIHLMNGEYDNHLAWPFQGEFVVELVNWKEDKNHLSQRIVFDEHTDPKFSSCVLKDSIINYFGKSGSGDVFLHSSLPYNPVTNTQYLQDDCLRFRVKEIFVRK